VQSPGSAPLLGSLSPPPHELGSGVLSARKFGDQRTGVSISSGPPSYLYSPECVEGESLKYVEIGSIITHLGDAL
jgi:hypothetical protein